MDKKALIAALESEILKVRTTISDLKEMTGPVEPDDAIGRVSRMDAINNQAITDAALRQAEQKLDELERMQTRQDEPDLGLCARCGKPIPMQRLLLVPHSTHCVTCAERI
jgi:DnaK suppressor protein